MLSQETNIVAADASDAAIEKSIVSEEKESCHYDVETEKIVQILEESFFEFVINHSMMGHMDLFLDKNQEGRVLDKEIFGGYNSNAMELMKRENAQLGGTPQFFYCKINMATCKDLETMEGFNLIHNPHVQECLRYGASYIYFPYMTYGVESLKGTDMTRHRNECCEKIKQFLFNHVKISPQDFASLTIQTTMILKIDELSDYCKEKRQWMVDNIEYNVEPRVTGRKQVANEPQKSFELVELGSSEEFVQFWTCQSDAFCGIPQISDSLKNLLRDGYQVEEQENSFGVRACIVGVRQKTANGREEIVACGELVMGKEVASINHIATRENHRNQGFAAFLLVSLIDVAKKFGYENVVLEATSMGIGIYSRLGFKPFYDYYVFEINHDQ